ncbi:hypothetical protein D8M04_11180 [Oceanobacillus piezotolerans]|uniref:Uncharacterized protein n=1 Tax=Oceanobacillus piezotolerans TaxID=2448030 RepID=A0A498D6P2_9BACI|nr:hypothetical protein [Oceanobacillus piezotolerans]RLL45408.1 hypothetical protein D8M04_11180 [Oceanobacillus piezotolerans]
MRVKFKFTDGLQATVENFSDLPRERSEDDLFDVFQAIKDNNSPIIINDDRSGKTLNRNGKELVSVELLLD